MMFVFTVMILVSWIVLHNWFDLNNINIVNRMEEMIWWTPKIVNKAIINNNNLKLASSQNQSFYIKDKNNIVITSTDKGSNNVMIDFVNTKNIWKKQEVFQEGNDYSIYKCSNKDCSFKKKDDIIIYKIVNNNKNNEFINEFVITWVKPQKISVSFLKKDSNNNVVYNWTAIYIIKTWDNNIKFPTVTLKPNETLFIKSKIINENLNI